MRLNKTKWGKEQESTYGVASTHRKSEMEFGNNCAKSYSRNKVKIYGNELESTYGVASTLRKPQIEFGKQLSNTLQ